MTKGSELTPDELEGMLVRKPKVLARDEVVLESETEEVQNQVLEVRDGVKVRVRTTIVTSVTRYVTIREYNPDLSYEDSVHQFTNAEVEGE